MDQDQGDHPQQGSGLVLKNGNTLSASGGGNSVVEVTPEKKIVWEISKNIPGSDIELGWMTTVQQLGNGNYVIGNCHAEDDDPQIFEITREGKKSSGSSTNGIW